MLNPNIIKSRFSNNRSASRIEGTTLKKKSVRRVRNLDELDENNIIEKLYKIEENLIRKVDLVYTLEIPKNIYNEMFKSIPSINLNDKFKYVNKADVEFYIKKFFENRAGKNNLD